MTDKTYTEDDIMKMSPEQFETFKQECRQGLIDDSQANGESPGLISLRQKALDTLFILWEKGRMEYKP